MPSTQIKKGYLRGVVGMVITPINADGSEQVGAVSYGIKTAQEVSVENEVVEGEAGELRGGDKLLAYAKLCDSGQALQFRGSGAHTEPAGNRLS